MWGKTMPELEKSTQLSFADLLGQPATQPERSIPLVEEAAPPRKEAATTPHQPSPEQSAIIHAWGQGMAVMAGAGSGKTTTLVAKCARLIELNPEAKFIAVSFTERSANDLREKLANLFFEKDLYKVFSQQWIMTIHGLCAAVIRQHSVESGFEGEESVLSETDSQRLWERAIESLWLDDVPTEIRECLERLYFRESQESIENLLKRVRELASFGGLDSLRGSADLNSRALEKVASFVLEKYQRLKWRRGAIDFNDLERGAEQALRHPAVCAVFHKKFDLVLIDEFQDTNPVQARIIRRIARPDESNLCVVGDPKQSIYRFRDADVSVFEEFCTRLPLRKSLTWNFRSRSGIIHFVNETCAKVFAASKMHFEPLVAKKSAGSANESVVRLDVENPRQLGEWIQGEIARGIELHDMVLLVRKIRGSEKWLKALRTCGIPIALGSGGLFWEDPRVRELVAFLKWVQNPGQTLAGAVFLRSPWMGLSDLTLEEWIKSDPTFYEPFFNSDHPVAQNLKKIVDRGSVRPGELLLGLLISQDIEDELGSPLLGLWHRVEEMSSGGADFYEVVVELAQSIQQKRREKEVPAPHNMGHLAVLTLHGSKGLEFPHVILIDFGDKPRAADTPLLFWDRQLGAYLGARDSSGERDLGDPHESQWRSTEKQKELAESKRLFYVALTRAKERLILVCPALKRNLKALMAEQGIEPAPAKKSSRKTDEEENPFVQDDWRNWIENSGFEIPPALTQIRGPGSVTGSELATEVGTGRSRTNVYQPIVKWQSEIPLMRARHSVTEWVMLSRCPRAYEWTYIRPVTVEKSEEEVAESLAPTHMTYQQLGTEVHACLERGDWVSLNGLEEKAAPLPFSAASLLEWAQGSAWMRPRGNYPDGEVWTELAFEVPITFAPATSAESSPLAESLRSTESSGVVKALQLEGTVQTLVGAIDRVVLSRVNGTDQYVLIDFKVTEQSKKSYSLLATYQSQMELYAWALQRLEPQVKSENLRAYLVHISVQEAAAVQVVSVPLGNLAVDRLFRLATEIIQGLPGTPRPGKTCQLCQFRAKCDVAITD